MEKGIVYCAHCTLTNKKYIGQTTTPLNVRISKHKANYKLNKRENKFFDAIKEYGFNNFIFGVIEEVDSTFLSEREIYWISYYNTYDDGYNSTLGGRGNTDPTRWMEFTIMDPSGKIYKDKNMTRFCKEHRLHNSVFHRVLTGKLQSHKGWKLPDTKLKTRVFKCVISPSGIVYQVNNVTQFCREHNLSPTHLVKVLNGKRIHHKNWKAYCE